MRKNRAGKKRKIVSLISTSLALIIAFCVYLGKDGIVSLWQSAGINGSNKFDTSQDFVRFLDVGQGDSILIYSNGRSMLLDTSTANYGSEVCYGLNDCGIEELDVLMLSHLHSDHTGGVSKVCESFGVKNLVLPEMSVESEGLSSAEYAMNAVKQDGGGIYNAVQGMNFTVGEFEITVLASFGELDDENNRSLFVMAEIDGIKFFFSGDAEKQAEKLLLEEGLDLDCDVMKAGHHGSNTSNSDELLDELTPEYAAISCGADNSYGHPHKEVTQSFEQRGIEYFRTDTKGDITFYVEDGKIIPQTEK